MVDSHYELHICIFVSPSPPIWRGSEMQVVEASYFYMMWYIYHKLWYYYHIM